MSSQMLTHFLMAELGCLASTPTFSLCMGGASKRVGLQGCAQMGFSVLFIVPFPTSSVALELPGSSETEILGHPASVMGLNKRNMQLLSTYYAPECRLNAHLRPLRQIRVFSFCSQDCGSEAHCCHHFIRLLWHLGSLATK